MAKKATTIILVIVVLFLLASTVYVSIILTSEDETSPTTPRQSRASEIEDTTVATDGANPDDSVNTLIGDTELTPTETVDSLTQQQEQTQDDENSEETEDADLQAQNETTGDEDATETDPANPEADQADESSLLAYANPSPTGKQSNGNNQQSQSQPKTSPTGVQKVSPTVAITQDELPGTGKGQTTRTASAAATVTIAPTTVQQQQQVSQTLPVAGSMTGSIVAVVVAGVTILASFFF